MAVLLTMALTVSGGICYLFILPYILSATVLLIIVDSQCGVYMDMCACVYANVIKTPSNPP